MKLTKIANLMVLGTTLTIAAAGCRHTPLNTTTLKNPNERPGGSGGLGGEGGISQGNGINDRDKTMTGGGEVSTGDFSRYSANSEILKADTIYFDYDKSAVKASEQSKLDAVAEYMKSHPEVAIRCEGNCDERGTEEYNRALGERRALAAREYLVRRGANAQMIVTISYGLDHPVEAAHNESAFSKNRRDDFSVLTPPGK